MFIALPLILSARLRHKSVRILKIDMHCVVLILRVRLALRLVHHVRRLVGRGLDFVDARISSVLAVAQLSVRGVASASDL